MSADQGLRGSERLIPVWLTVATALLLGGCGGLDPAEEETKKLVEGLGGTVVVEDGHIVQIKLDNSKVQDSHIESFKSLPSLQELHLNYTEVTDAVFASAAEMKALKELNLMETKITVKAVNKFHEEHPDVAVSGPGA